MTDRAMQGLKPLLSTRRELETFVRELKDGESLTPEQIEAFEKQVERSFPGGFDHRDEAKRGSSPWPSAMAPLRTYTPASHPLCSKTTP